MYMKPLYYERSLSPWHVTTVAYTLVIAIVLIAGCDGCGSSRRSPRPSAIKTTAKAPATPSSSSSGGPSATSQFENYLCFSITVENLTNEDIYAKLKQLSNSGNLSKLFIYNTAKRSLFLKWFKPNHTGCLNVTQGYVIELRNISHGNDSYEYNITQLSNTSTTEHCRHIQSCIPLSFSSVSTTTTVATSIITTENSSVSSVATSTSIKTKVTSTTPTKETTKKESEGIAAAEKTDDGVSTTTILIPVIVVILLVVVLILAVWFKRRSAKKQNEENKQQGSDHVVGPLNGDMYSLVNPGADRKKNEKSDSDLLYTELSHIKPRGNGETKQPEPDQTDYADITHILTPAETTYENVTLQTDEAYSNVVQLNSEN